MCSAHKIGKGKMGVENIGDYIGYDGDFKCAFWTTYSIDFSTAYFIINQHIRPLIDGQPCHIMMDLRKAHEACQEDGANFLKPGREMRRSLMVVGPTPPLRQKQSWRCLG